MKKRFTLTSIQEAGFSKYPDENTHAKIYIGWDWLQEYFGEPNYRQKSKGLYIGVYRTVPFTLMQHNKDFSIVFSDTKGKAEFVAEAIVEDVLAWDKEREKECVVAK